MADVVMRFVANRPGIAALAGTKEMATYLGMRADAAAVEAQKIAPVETGDYRDSIEGQSGFAESIAIGRVVAKDFKAGWIEFGTVKWPAHATLRKGCEATGLVIRGGGRYKWRPKKNGGWF